MLWARTTSPTPRRRPNRSRIINRALDAGINLIDTSNSYAKGEAERIIGRALADNGRRHAGRSRHQGPLPHRPRPQRPRQLAPAHRSRPARTRCAACKPTTSTSTNCTAPSFDIPIDETLGALTDLVRQGKVRYIGSSTAPAWKVMEALMVSELKGYARFVSEQPPYNLLDRRIENELVPMCQAHGLGILPWSPLAMGILAGRYADAETAFRPTRAPACAAASTPSG